MKTSTVLLASAVPLTISVWSLVLPSLLLVPLVRFLPSDANLKRAYDEGSAEEQLFLEVIDQAEARSHERGWKTCSRCGEPIGDARLEALPATDLCVTCKADRASW